MRVNQQCWDFLLCSRVTQCTNHCWFELEPVLRKKTAKSPKKALTPRRADNHFSDPWSLKWSCTFSFLLILIWLYYFCGMFHIHDIHFFDALQSTKTISQAQEDHFSTKSHLEIYVFLLAFFNDHKSDHHVLGRV